MGKIENGVYFDSKGNPAHRGVVKIDGKLYYAGKNGVLAKDCRQTVHHGMANGLLEHGTYYFDPNGVCDVKSFRAPKKQREKKYRLTQKQKAVLSTALTALLVVLVIAAVLMLRRSLLNTDKQSSVPGSVSVLEPAQTLGIDLPDIDGEVSLCSDAMQAFYRGEYTLQEVADAVAQPYQPFVFEYKLQNAQAATLLLSEHADYSDSTQYPLNVRASVISVDNLKTGTTYYYLVTATDADGKQKAEGGSFQTARTNRFISLSGLYNTRDIGGYETADGKTVREGLLIRGTEPDGLVNSNYYLQDAAEAAPFGFVCDFDLRSSDVFSTAYVSRFGKRVSHKFYNAPMYGAIFQKSNAPLLKQIFTDLANRRNYPMYLHCTYGADRTGTVVYLLLALLGVCEQDLMTEYQLTGFFSKVYFEGSDILPVYTGLQAFPGATLQEKTENFLLDSVGLTEQQIQSLRRIFLEKKQ